MRYPLAIVAALAVAVPAFAADLLPDPSPELMAAIASPQRTPANVLRDKYRHPAETLTFFGVKPTQTIVEFIPGGGWYSEILAPYVKGKGRYVPLVNAKGADKANAYFAAHAAAFGPVEVATFTPDGTTTLQPNSADVILTFRNVHNLLMGEDAAAPAMFKAFYAALKPGGTLGVVDHRLPEAMDGAKQKTSGYVKGSTILKLATDAGFRLAGESEINANPKDTHDYAKGVWTLPPTFAEGDADKAKYQAIGESDRLTMKFVKPAR